MKHCQVITLFCIFIISCSGENSSGKQENSLDDEKMKAATLKLLQNARSMDDLFDPDTINLIIPADFAVGRVVALHLTNHNDVVLLDHLFARTALLFNREGQFICRIGDNGQGPGEYINPAFVTGNQMDEIIIGDLAIPRVNIYSRDGKFLRSFNVPHRNWGVQISPDDDIIIHDIRAAKRNATINVYTRKGKLLRRFGNTSDAFQKLLAIKFRSLGQHITHDGKFIYETDYTDYHVRKYSNDGKSIIEFGIKPEQYRSLLETNYEQVVSVRGRAKTKLEEKRYIDYMSNEFPKSTLLRRILTLCPGIIYTNLVNKEPSGFDKNVYCEFYDSDGNLLKSGLTFSRDLLTHQSDLKAVRFNKLAIVNSGQYSEEKQTIQLILLNLKTEKKL